MWCTGAALYSPNPGMGLVLAGIWLVCVGVAIFAASALTRRWTWLDQALAVVLMAAWFAGAVMLFGIYGLGWWQWLVA